MRFLITGGIALVAVCRFAEGGEGVTTATDPMHALFRLLTDFGALGVFIIYLIWQKREDGKKQQKDSERWYAMDQSLIGLVEKCTLAISESTSAICEIRTAMHENNREMRRMHTVLATGKHHTRRDTDIKPSNYE